MDYFCRWRTIFIFDFKKDNRLAYKCEKCIGKSSSISKDSSIQSTLGLPTPFPLPKFGTFKAKLSLGTINVAY